MFMFYIENIKLDLSKLIQITLNILSLQAFNPWGLEWKEV